MSRTLISIILLIFTITNLNFIICTKTPNNRPIIGILAQEVTELVNSRLYPQHYDSYIAASYVKFVESAGARVVPIWINKPKLYYNDILSKINGVLWPGGAADFTLNSGYGGAAYKIYKIAKEMNDRGDYFPIFATCLGFETLTYLAADRRNTTTKCSSENIALPLNFMPGYRNSRLFGNASAEVTEILKRNNVTSNFHHFCVTEEGLKNKGIQKKFRILSTSSDRNGKKFISSLESSERNECGTFEYPFYGLQFHPEKNIYEWANWKTIPHSAKAVQVAQYFANFFVNEARRSAHTFKSEEEEANTLIYNFSPVYTGVHHILFEQCYMFNN